jgi:hypothetical protein
VVRMIRNWGRRSQPVDLPCATAAPRLAAVARGIPAVTRNVAGHGRA